MLQIGGTPVYFCQESLKKRFLLKYFEGKVIEKTLETMQKRMKASLLSGSDELIVALLKKKKKVNLETLHYKFDQTM